MRIFVITLVIIAILISCTQKESPILNVYKDERLNTLLTKSNNDSLPFQKRYKYISEAEKIINKLPNDSLNRKFRFKIAARLWNMSAMEDYRTNVSSLINLAKKADDSVSIGKGYKFLGDYYNYKFQPEMAYSCYFKAQKVLSSIHDTINLFQTILEKSALQYYEGDIVGAEKSAYQALRYLAKSKNYESLHKVYNLLGITFGELNDFKAALSYHEKALSYASSDNIPSSSECYAISYNNLGYLFKSVGNTTKAVYYFQKGLKSKKLFLNQPLIFAALTDNLASCTFDENTMLSLKKALTIRDSLKNYPGIISSESNISEYYARKKDTACALKHANTAYLIAQKHKVKRDMLTALKLLSKLDRKNTRTHTQKYYRLNDSIQLAERKIVHKFARIEYETDNLIRQKNQLKAENARKDQKLWTVAGLFGSALLLLIIAYLLNRQRLKNREIALLRQQQQSDAEIYELRLAQQQRLDEGRQQEKSRIARELHDGVMGKLAGIRLNLFVLSRRRDDATIEQCLARVDEIREVEQEIRNITYDLGKNTFDGPADFLHVLRGLFETAQQHSGIALRLDTDPEIPWDTIPSQTKMQLYRIVQEGLQNIVKYAQATQVELTLERQHSRISVTLQDNGKGFDLARTPRGLGLDNMRQRAQNIGGKFRIASTPGAGTSLKVIFPLTQNKAA